MTKQIITLLKYVPIFALIPDVLLSKLNSIVQQRTIPKGHKIFVDSVPANSFYIIKSGDIEIYKIDPASNKKTLLAAISEGEFWGEISILEEMPYHAAAMAMNESVIYEIPIEKFKKMLERNPDLDVCFMGVLSEQLRRLDLQMIDDLQQRCRLHEQAKIEHAMIAEILENTLSNLNHFVIAVDNEDKIIYSNDTAQSLFGNAETAFINTNINSIIVPISNDSIYKDINLSLSENKIWTGDLLVSSSNEKRLYIKLTAIRTLDEGSKDYITIYTGQDITNINKAVHSKTSTI